MTVRNLMFALAAGSLVAAPLAAQPGPATVDRQSAPVASKSELGSGNNLFFILGILAVAAGIVFLSEDDDAASP